MICEHKFRLNAARKGHGCPDCYPYQVGDEFFETFAEVQTWAWNTHKVDLSPLVDDRLMTEDQKQEACDQLAEMIKDF